MVIAGDFNSHGKVEELAKAGFLWVTTDLGDTARLRLLGIGLGGLAYDHVLARGLRPAPGPGAMGVVPDNRGASDHKPDLGRPRRRNGSPGRASLTGPRRRRRSVLAVREAHRCDTARPSPLVLLARAPSTGGRRRRPAIPLPEHPRPDFERAEWVNLNGDWSFRFDPANAGGARALVRDGARAASR